jgi:hypothetical protein
MSFGSCRTEKSKPGVQLCDRCSALKAGAAGVVFGLHQMVTSDPSLLSDRRAKPMTKPREAERTLNVTDSTTPGRRKSSPASKPECLDCNCKNYSNVNHTNALALNSTFLGLWKTACWRHGCRPSDTAHVISCRYRRLKIA